MGMIKEFKDFAVKGNVVDMGVGIVIGAAFTSVVNSFVKDIVTPVMSLFTSGINYSNWFCVIREGKKGGDYSTIEKALSDGAVVINIGVFINAIISFLIVALVLFMVIRSINKAKKLNEKEEEEVKKTMKECPECLSEIKIAAKKCSFCTSSVS